MDPRIIARLLVAGRLAIGSMLLAQPDRAAQLTVRRRRRRADAAKLLRLVGLRDVVLASGLQTALAGRGSVRAWALAGALADAVDLAGTLAMRDELEPQAFGATVAAAGGGVVLGVLASGAES
jgi:hypothetical protein